MISSYIWVLIPSIAIFIPVIVHLIKKRARIETYILSIGFMLYIAFDLYKLFLPIRLYPLVPFTQDYCFIPFTRLIPYLTHGAPEIFFKILIGNIFLLFPLGLLGPVLFSRLNNIKIIIICGYVIILVIIVLKFVINNLTQVDNYLPNIDELILNPIGLILGYLMQKHFRIFLHKHKTI